MTPLSLVPPDSPILRAIAAPVLLPMPGLKRLIRAMTDLCRQHNGAGLAAPQVGVSLRVIVLRLTGIPSCMVNPEWKPCAGSTMRDEQEGCLSLPGQKRVVARYERIMVRHAEAPTWRLFDGMAARTIQHEVDHLDGKLITDHQQHAVIPMAIAPLTPLRLESA